MFCKLVQTIIKYVLVMFCKLVQTIIKYVLIERSNEGAGSFTQMDAVKLLGCTACERRSNVVFNQNFCELEPSLSW